MAIPLTAKLTYSELYSDDTMNPFGMETKAGYTAHCGKTARGCGGGFCSAHGRHRNLRGRRRIRHPAPGGSPRTSAITQDRKLLFGLEGGVVGVDIATVAMDNTWWEITVAVNVPGTATRVLQLLGAEPEYELMGPFRASEANVRQIKTRGGGHVNPLRI
jgi:hypothetical protein